MVEKFAAIQLEQLVLHSILEDLTLFYPVREVLKVEHFFDESHKSIYKGIRELDDKLETITVETLSAWLMQNDNNALTKLAQLLTVSAIPDIKPILIQIIELANKRKLWFLSIQIQSTLVEKTSADVVNLIDETIVDMDAGGSTQARSYRELREFYESMPPLPMQKTGTFVDQPLGGGPEQGRLILLMGDAEAGKTTLGLQMLEFVAKSSFCLFFCFEFTVRQYIKNTAQRKKEVYLDSQNRELKNLTVSDNLQIIDKGYDISDIEREVKIWHKKGCRFVFIDSQMRVENSSKSNASVEVKESDKFSRLAKLCHRYEITIIYICQQAKEDTKSGIHIPMGSKKGAHEADMIWYIERFKPKFDENGDDENQFKRNFIVSKNKQTGKHFKRDIFLNPTSLTFHKVYKKHEEVDYDEKGSDPKIVKDDKYKLPTFDMPKV